MVAVDVDVLAVHEEVVGLADVAVAEANVAAVPECFGGVGYYDVSEVDAVHFAEHFGGFDSGVAHGEVA